MKIELGTVISHPIERSFTVKVILVTKKYVYFVRFGDRFMCILLSSYPPIKWGFE
jgi:hypothetical protein